MEISINDNEFIKNVIIKLTIPNEANLNSTLKNTVICFKVD